jgi:GNAT superfamily N-acetyltransferase
LVKGFTIRLKSTCFACYLAGVQPAPARVISEAPALTEEQRQHLIQFAPDVFGLRHLNLTWEPKTCFFPVHVGGALVANAALVWRTVTVGDGGQRIPVAGLGSVVTRPEARGRGHATAAITAALAFARREWGVEFAMLFCRPELVPFYERIDFASLPPPILIDQPGGKIASPTRVLVRPLASRPWPPGPIDVNGPPW